MFYLGIHLICGTFHGFSTSFILNPFFLLPSNIRANLKPIFPPPRIITLLIRFFTSKHTAKLGDGARSFYHIYHVIWHEFIFTTRYNNLTIFSENPYNHIVGEIGRTVKGLLINSESLSALRATSSIFLRQNTRFR